MSKGPAPYDDVYLDEHRSSDEDDGTLPGNLDSKPLISNHRKPQKSKIQVRHPKPKKPSYYKKKRCFLKWTYLTLALVAVVLFVFVLVKVVHDAMLGRYTNLGLWGGGFSAGQEELVPCSGFSVEPVWIKNIPTVSSETAVRMVDVNRDGILDVILGFGTMAQGLFGDEYLLCGIYYNGQQPCFGGLLALDGNTGEEIWRHYSPAEIYAVNCNEDIDLDGVKDCLGAGRAGQFELINGATGAQMWTFADRDLIKEYVSNLYTPQYIEDVDGDGIPDVINIHGGDPLRKTDQDVKVIAKVIVFSGRTGEILSWSQVPDKQESYYSPQVYTKSDGSKIFLFGTGGETKGGRLFAVSVLDVVKGNLTESVKHDWWLFSLYSDMEKSSDRRQMLERSTIHISHTDNLNHCTRAKVIYHSPLKGIMTPPVLADITNDGVVDIIFVPFNGSVVAMNGETFETIWNMTVPFSESYSTPGAGYFNDDAIPDFMIVFNYGPGYPLYYYSQVTVLDGRNGALLIDPPIISSGSVQSSSLAVSFEGWGNDAFIYWSLVCKDHEHETTQFGYANGVIGGMKSRINFCKERFGTDDITKQFILTQSMSVPGDTVYDSSQYFDVEHSNPVNASALALKFLEAHPEVKNQVIQKALQRHHHTEEVPAETPKATTPQPPPPESHDDAEADDDEEAMMGKFISYLNGHFDPEQRRKMLQELLAETSEPETLGTREFDLDSSDDGSRLDLSDNSGGYTRQHASRRGGQGESYPQNLENYLYDIQQRKSFPYQAPLYKKDRRRRAEHDDEKLFESVTEMFTERREKRHLGNHDAEGIQRLLATGSLAPPLDAESVVHGDSIDVVFPVYWFYPQDGHLVLPEEEECIKGYMDDEEQRMHPENEFYGMDHDGFMNSVEEICIKRENQEKVAKMAENIDPTSLYPFNIDAGIMTVYRLRLTCRCDVPPDAAASGRRCAKVLPYQEQRWPAYLGRNADSFFDP